jgi:hypothetical protein
MRYEAADLEVAALLMLDAFALLDADSTLKLRIFLAKISLFSSKNNTDSRFKLRAHFAKKSFFSRRDHKRRHAV